MQNAFADSLYDLKTNWRDTENNKTDVSIAKGSYAIIAMVYTGCAHACPMTIGPEPMSKIFLISVRLGTVRTVLPRRGPPGKSRGQEAPPPRDV